MKLTKAQIVDAIYDILTTTVANNRFFEARARGFRSELEFENYVKSKKLNILTGGQFLFRQRNNQGFHQLVYVTVTFESPKNYLSLYNKISQLPIVTDLFFIELEPINKWSSCDIPVSRMGTTIKNRSIPCPTFKIFKYDSEKFVSSNVSSIQNLFPVKNSTAICSQKNKLVYNYLSDYPEDDIAEILANRYFLDVLLRNYKKGMIDFDFIIENKEGFIAVETKEKDPGGSGNNKYFGWDSRRLSWYLYLKQRICIDGWYVIREVNNQKQRNLVAWKYVTIDEFARAASWLSEMGGGGNSGTITVPYGLFKVL